MIVLTLPPRLFTPYRNTIFRNSSQTQSPAEYCLNLVKTHDYENFISTLLLKKTARSCALAVRSFNIEIARIAEQVSQKEIGLMRMQFWEDTLEKCCAQHVQTLPRHPVAIELYKAINNPTKKLSKRFLKNLLISRKEQLGVNCFASIEDLEKYCESSVSSVYYLILEGCGVRNVNADHAASHLGKAQGIVQQLRSIPHCHKFKFVPLPQSILNKNQISHEELFRGKSSAPLSDCVFEVAIQAHQHLLKSRSLSGKVPVEGRSAFLPAIAVDIYLDRLQKVDYDVFHPSLHHRSWNLLVKMWLSNFKNKY